VLSLSIVSHGDSMPLRELLDSLVAFESLDRIQLIVTDNLCSDLTDPAPQGWQSVEVLRPPRPRGFAANHNAAFERAVGTYFCVLNPDVRLIEPVFNDLMAHLAVQDAEMTAPVLADSRGEIQDSFRGLPTPREILRRRLSVRGATILPTDGRPIRPDWIAGMFMLMRSSTFSGLGGFDPHFRMYFEDVDLCTRLRLSGGRILVDPAKRVLHDPRRRSRRPGQHFLWHTQSAVRFFVSDVYQRARRMSSDA
jgi:hypothetical protein